MLDDIWLFDIDEMFLKGEFFKFYCSWIVCEKVFVIEVSDSDVVFCVDIIVVLGCCILGKFVDVG